MPIAYPQPHDDPAEIRALRALGWVLADDGRAGRFVALTGIAPDDLRARAGERDVLDAALGFLEGHEPDLIACAHDLGISPVALLAARGELKA